jgi:hypothetical protein
MQQLLDEYDLTLDDVRWYIALTQAHRLLRYKDQPRELAREIWAGRLEADLYNMEERFIADRDERLANKVTSEHRVREELTEIRAAKRKRQD